MTQEQINKYSVLMAEYMGITVFDDIDANGNKYFYYNNFKMQDFEALPNYHSDYNELIKVWVKFRDLYEPELGKALWDVKENIKTIIVMKPIEEAFEELGKAIEWYNTIKK
jgi:hypothetical protein